MIKIETIMSKDVSTAELNTPISIIINKLYNDKLGAIVIINNKNVPIGIITERDIVGGLYKFKEQLLKKKAREVMTSPIVYISPDSDIEEAAILMALNRIRRLPVINDNKLVGIISYKDLANTLRKNYYSLEEKTEILEDKANKDALTSLYNKGYIFDQLKYQISLSQSTKKPFSIIMIDIDHFKKVNDTFGHLCGDYVLKKISSIFSEQTRSVNIIGRYGGEEFLILCPGSDKYSAFNFAERLRTLIENMQFAYEGKNFKITISAGVAEFDNKIKKPETLIANADTALYQAKNSGRNRTVIFNG
jgi:diguanylate cyclase (GGDEF)-like protein